MQAFRTAPSLGGLRGAYAVQLFTRRKACSAAAQASPQLTLPRPKILLGIESSCDDTGAAVVTSEGRVLGEDIAGQADIHAPWGGVVPNLAMEAHKAAIDRVVANALEQAGIQASQLDAVAVTVGPGLSLCLRVGVVKAMALAAQHCLPLVRVHHMEAHALVARLVDAYQPPQAAPTTLPANYVQQADGRLSESSSGSDSGTSSSSAGHMDGIAHSGVPFPFLCLLVSGGHNLVVLVQGVGRYVQLGTTVDDALGEAFDKVARLLSLDPKPSGGAALEKLAREGDPQRIKFKIPMRNYNNANFSFAGLKTSVRMAIDAHVNNAQPSSLPGAALALPSSPSSLPASEHPSTTIPSEAASSAPSSTFLSSGAAPPSTTWATTLTASPQAAAPSTSLPAPSTSTAASPSPIPSSQTSSPSSTHANSLSSQQPSTAPSSTAPFLTAPSSATPSHTTPQQHEATHSDAHAGSNPGLQHSSDGQPCSGKDTTQGDRQPSTSGRDSLQQVKADIAASFQHVATVHLVEKLGCAIKWAKESNPEIRHLVVAGGVACNQYIRGKLQQLASNQGLELVLPPPKWCTDNGVMVAWAGHERLALGLQEPPPSLADMSDDDTWVDLRPRWPLTTELHPAVAAAAAAAAASSTRKRKPRALFAGSNSAASSSMGVKEHRGERKARLHTSLTELTAEELARH